MYHAFVLSHTYIYIIMYIYKICVLFIGSHIYMCVKTFIGLRLLVCIYLVCHQRNTLCKCSLLELCHIILCTYAISQIVALSGGSNGLTSVASSCTPTVPSLLPRSRLVCPTSVLWWMGSVHRCRNTPVVWFKSLSLCGSRN